jgi:nucleotide-binding universal stress UspA family protein
MYRKVLVPMALDHDLSPQTLAIAKALTHGTGEIVALHVYEKPNASVSAYLDAGAVEEGYQRATAELAKKLSAIDGITGKIIKGHTYRTIIDYAAQNNVDCIVIGSHKPGLSDYLLGSTAARVVRHAPCAVHVHRGT